MHRPRVRGELRLLGAHARCLGARGLRPLVTGLSEGEPAIRALLRRLGEWRVPPWWYGVVFGLPVAEGILSLGVAALLGKTNAPSTDRLEQLRAVGPVLWVAYVFAASEEIGWRGFALPCLLASRSAFAASLILGAVHAVWHWLTPIARSVVERRSHRAVLGVRRCRGDRLHMDLPEHGWQLVDGHPLPRVQQHRDGSLRQDRPWLDAVAQVFDLDARSPGRGSLYWLRSGAPAPQDQRFLMLPRRDFFLF